jgi:hypothetical protein
MLTLQLIHQTATMISAVHVQHATALSSNHLMQLKMNATTAAPTSTPASAPTINTPTLNGTTGNSFTDIFNFARSIQSLVTAVGLVIFFIGIGIAGILRMISAGNERRIAVSNMALTAAIVGLVIVLAGNGIYGVLSKAFGTAQ